MKKLTDLANLHFTDKGTVAFEAHGYTEIYNDYIPDHGEYTLLEIGVWHGDSLRMWLDYNPEANIHAIDIDEKCLNYVHPNLWQFVHIGNATDAKFLSKVIQSMGRPNYIIDDGSHRYNDIIRSFSLLYPALKHGGYYFIEDLHAPYAEAAHLRDYLNIIVGEENIIDHGKLLIIKK